MVYAIINYDIYHIYLIFKAYAIFCNFRRTIYIYIYIYALRHSVSLDNYVSGDQEKKRKIE